LPTVSGGLPRLLPFARMDTVRFEAPWDGGIRWITAGTTLAVVLACAGAAAVGSGIAAPFAGTPGGTVLTVALSLVPIPALLILYAAIGEAPRAFTVGPTAVTIERRAGPVSIPLSSIREVSMLGPGVSMRRMSGSGGLFGWYGLFEGKGIGNVRLYATRDTGRVLLATDAGFPVVVTPGDPESFVTEVRRRLGSPG
jgi:hypothetical protein